MSLTVGLAVLTIMPILQFAVFGYMLEAAARASQIGGLRFAVTGVRAAAHGGVAVLFSILWWTPIWLLEDRTFAAQLIVPGTSTHFNAARLSGWTTALVVLHLAAAWLKGARIRDFLQPWASAWWWLSLIRRPTRFTTAIYTVAEHIERLRLAPLCWLGLRAFVGSLLWLLIPAGLLAAGPNNPALGFLGAGLLAFVLFRLPILQVRFARSGQFKEFGALLAAREVARGAPLLWTLAILVLTASALPLYGFKVEPLPNGFWWLAALFFVAMMLPAKLLLGFVVGVAERRTRPANRLWRYGMHLIALPAAAIYVFWAFLTPYVGFNGVVQLLFEQHALLLPAPIGPFQ